VAPSLIAGVLVLAGRFWRPIFWPALAGLAVTLVFVVPSMASLLSVDAYPTTFVTSPTEFADSSIMHGASLFAANCTGCHGADAKGDGPAAKTLPVPPADLTAPHFWGHTDGDLFWYISHGLDAPSGAPAMPAFAGVLSSGDIWALIDFLKANNAGYSMRTAGSWSQPIQMPQFDAVCADGSAIDLDDLRARWRPGDPGDWSNHPQALATVIRDIAAHPLAVAAGGGHAHHH
jgi:mono/diheme cytochrome c family protein